MASKGLSSDMEAFKAQLKSSNRIIALLGAGLSAASGLPTFRGVGGIWRNYQAQSLATREAFSNDPGLVWHFYNYRRHMALNAMPNPAHYALAELSKHKEFIALSQNVDGLCVRAGHPTSKLFDLHGSLFDIKCSDEGCGYFEKNNFKDPIVPALAIPTESQPEPANTTDGIEATKNLLGALQGGSGSGKELDIADAKVKLPELRFEDLPLCPKCKTSLLRPGVVWFGEPLPELTLGAIDSWLMEHRSVDLIMVIGTSAQVYPAAGYVTIAQNHGAKVAVINMDEQDSGSGGIKLGAGDWYFQGDAGKIVPDLLEPVTGKLSQETGL